jgi:hypothetical protein
LHSYDDTLFDPPAPLATVTLRDPATGATLLGIPMLLDSGADVTLVPQKSVLRLGMTLQGGEGVELRGFDGSTSVASAVRLDMSLLGKTFKGRFLVIDQEWGLLGRDVLNHLSLLFDGPGLTWHERKKT